MLKKLVPLLIACLCLLVAYLYISSPRPPDIRNFSEVKRLLAEEVYHDHRYTIYCNAPFDSERNIILPEGFETPVHKARASRVEWEHAVPAENFGRFFREWREGDPRCVSNGKPYKGRRCAEKVSPEFRKMAYDMYNLFPAIGAVNAARNNLPYAQLADAESSFGSCQAKIAQRKFEPPQASRGQLARASLYMDAEYPEFHLSAQQKRLFEAWSRQYPVDKWECIRASRIERLQGNENKFVSEPCRAAGFWHSWALLPVL